VTLPGIAAGARSERRRRVAQRRVTMITSGSRRMPHGPVGKAGGQGKASWLAAAVCAIAPSGVPAAARFAYDRYRGNVFRRAARAAGARRRRLAGQRHCPGGKRSSGRRPWCRLGGRTRVHGSTFPARGCRFCRGAWGGAPAYGAPGFSGPGYGGPGYGGPQAGLPGGGPAGPWYGNPQYPPPPQGAFPGGPPPGQQYGQHPFGQHPFEQHRGRRVPAPGSPAIRGTFPALTVTVSRARGPAVSLALGPVPPLPTAQATRRGRALPG